jgi:hypothetical protein
MHFLSAISGCDVNISSYSAYAEQNWDHTQLKTLATKIHGLAVKSWNGKKTVQNKASKKIEAEVKQVSIGITFHVRGLAEKPKT